MRSNLGPIRQRVERLAATTAANHASDVDIVAILQRRRFAGNRDAVPPRAPTPEEHAAFRALAREIWARNGAIRAGADK